jgi:hypothetical protein
MCRAWLTYFAKRGAGAWRQEKGAASVRIQTSQVAPERIRIVASKDHAGPEVEEMLRRLPGAEVKSIGSSLKFCLVAEERLILSPLRSHDEGTRQRPVCRRSGWRFRANSGRLILSYGKPTWKNAAMSRSATRHFSGETQAAGTGFWFRSS